VLTLVALAALEVPLAIVEGRNERQDLTAKVERDAFVAASLVEDTLERGTPSGGSSSLRRFVAAYAARSGARAVITDARGVAVADSSPTRTGEVDFASRPEVAAALRGATVSGTRSSKSLGARLLYVAVPVASSGHVYGVVRITIPMSEVDRRLHRYVLALVGVGVAVLGAAAVIGLLLARWIARPLARVEAAAARVGTGDLSARAPEDEGPPEVRRLARELNETTVKLGSLLHSQEQFVADASHELRTPLTALRLRLENLDPIPQEAVAEAERLARVVDELLALARADASTEPADELDLGALARRRVEAWEPLAEERGVKVVVDGNGEVVVRAGEARVEQVLDNLLANALDASPDGSTIVVAVRGAELHVLDEGAGLSAEQRQRAFDRFWRASTAPGSGLGLSIARRLVETDEGEVELRKAASGGVDAVVRYASRR
jgi:signal transduction histidine kinase